MTEGIGMDAMNFLTMIEDKKFTDLKKMQYKYSKEAVAEMLELLKKNRYMLFPMRDFKGEPIIYLDELAGISPKYAKILLGYRGESEKLSSHAMEDEIYSTFDIENINTSRESVRKILAGYAPRDESEERIYGMKKGLEIISDYHNEINEENLYKLYQMAVGNCLDAEDRLPAGCKYRNNAVYVVGGKETHEGLPQEMLPSYMKAFLKFINVETDIDDLAKAAIIHFYMAYLHPYFDGNGRIARLLQMWYLVQRGYAATMLVSMSALIRESRNLYYKAYQLIEANEKISGCIDVTPFVLYFAENVYSHFAEEFPSQFVLDEFANNLLMGGITEKEHALWNYVLNHYGKTEFSTKQLEKDFGDAAYATIRSFVQKFQRLGLLEYRNYSNRPKYRVW